MISDQEYHRLTTKPRPRKNIVQFFRESPLAGIRLELERDKDSGRDARV
jgi:hypothetical protein